MQVKQKQCDSCRVYIYFKFMVAVNAVTTQLRFNDVTRVCISHVEGEGRWRGGEERTEMTAGNRITYLNKRS